MEHRNLEVPRHETRLQDELLFVTKEVQVTEFHIQTSLRTHLRASLALESNPELPSPCEMRDDTHQGLLRPQSLLQLNHDLKH